MKKYVISLKSRRKCDQGAEDMLKAIESYPDIKILDGEGLRSVTVEMRKEVADSLRHDIAFLTVEEYAELKLLGDNPRRVLAR